MDLSDKAEELRRELANAHIGEVLELRQVVLEAYRTRVVLASEVPDVGNRLRSELANLDDDYLLMLRNELNVMPDLAPHAEEWLQAVLAELLARES